ncbi:MAG: A/G-specific adenine glycosylase [Sphingomonadales bacterium]|nr:A/G-specific adenine glycosylase [Sphingomonadales bacterium]
MHEETVASSLLDWYDANARSLPWRVKGGEADPYRVWLSEIMLQQTTVKAVIPYFETFTSLWPDVRSLAKATDDEVMARWAGLGYYSRARNLIACARMITASGGRFPDTEKELLTLPGVGPYTAAAIASIAFGQSATVVDGNVERVVARLFAVRQPLPSAKRELKRLAETLTPEDRPGDFAQAMMDLGATICTPRKPSCLVCAVQMDCAANAKGIAASLPVRLERAERPLRVGIAFVALREDGHVLLRRRAEEGLLGGMLEVPSTQWTDLLPPVDDALRTAPLRGNWWLVPGTVRHTFTHFQLELVVYRAVVPVDATLTFWAEPDRCRWVARRDLDTAALPSVMRKVVAHGFGEH